MRQAPGNGRSEKYQLLSLPLWNLLHELKHYARAAYENLCGAHDATFELTDAVMLTRNT